MKRPIGERLRAGSDVNPETGCWEWRTARDYSPNAYGTISVFGKRRMAHRIAYAEWVGEVPEGMEVDHTCQVRSCINPDHLEIVMPSTNVRRATIRRREKYQ